MSYDETNRGAIFKNDKKDDDRSPDYTGNLNVEGTDYFIDCWIREAKSGRKFMSVRVKAKKAPAMPTTRSRDDDPPF